jgi:hypothetical protein
MRKIFFSFLSVQLRFDPSFLWLNAFILR